MADLMARSMAMRRLFTRLRGLTARISPEWWIALAAALAAIAATSAAYASGTILAYGDAESHLDIAKRVIDSITPGFAQLGGIWLPLPHLLLIPFVWNDFLWRSGLAGSIVSGVAFVIAAVFIYKLAFLITGDKPASAIAAFAFLSNPNMLYMQATPMTELPLIVFFVLSSYFFIRFLREQDDILMLICAAFFGFCATLSRYDGWGLVLMEAGIIFLAYIRSWRKLEGRLILFGTLAFLGILIWFGWGYAILGDPLYFTHSEFSAKSQQQSWLARGELPAFGSIGASLEYYADASMLNIGEIAAPLAILGCLAFLLLGNREDGNRWPFLPRAYILLVLLVPFIFNVATLFLGESVIFIPNLTPSSYQWNLFNVRYGLMMIPFAAIFIGYLIARLRHVWLKAATVCILLAQLGAFAIGAAPVVTLADGTHGLSSAIAKVPDAQTWLGQHYDHGMVLFDDYSRAISIIHSPIEMQDVIYVGNEPYWDISLKEPEKYARWIIMQRGDAVWTALYDDPAMQARLFKYFNKVYTSTDVYIFRRISDD